MAGLARGRLTGGAVAEAGGVVRPTMTEAAPRPAHTPAVLQTPFGGMKARTQVGVGSRRRYIASDAHRIGRSNCEQPLESFQPRQGGCNPTLRFGRSFSQVSSEGNTCLSFDIGTRLVVERPGGVLRGPPAQSRHAYTNAEQFAKSCYATPLPLSRKGGPGAGAPGRCSTSSGSTGSTPAASPACAWRPGFPAQTVAIRPLLGKLSRRAAF